MDSVWKGNFENSKVIYPKDIAIEYCNQLYELTNKLVIAKVEKYDQSIADMNSAAGALANLTDFKSAFKATVVEDYLGEISKNNKFTYELYITGINTPKYKYRFCFVENDIYPYPVNIIIDSDIAKELGCSTRIICEDEKKYKDVLINILNTNKLREVINGLMTINLESDE